MRSDLEGLGSPHSRALGHGLARLLSFAVGALALTACLMPTPVTAQTPQLKRLMQQKLEHSQAILAAVVTSNWSELERHSLAMERLTNEPAWAVLRTPEYGRFSQEFVRAVQDLIDAATRRDLEAAPLGYVSLTLSCVQCHRYVARARIAQFNLPGGKPSP